MEAYTGTNRISPRRGTKVNPIGALLCLMLGLLITALLMGYAVGVHMTDLESFKQAADKALVQTGIISAEHAERFAQETIGYLTGRRAAWLQEITLGGQTMPVPETFTQHMAEVQRWVKAVPYLIPLIIAVLIVLTFLTLIGAMTMRTRMFSPRGYLLGAAIPILFAALGLLWAAIDFRSFWDVLHRALIPGGIFAGDEAVMQLFPLTMFQEYLWPIALTFFYYLTLVLLVPIILMIADKSVRKRRHMRQTPYDNKEYR